MIMIIMTIMIIRIMIIIMTVMMMIDYNDVSQLKTVWLDSQWQSSWWQSEQSIVFSPSDLLGWQISSFFCGRGDDKDRDDSDDQHHLPRVNGQVVHCAGNPRAPGASVPFVNTIVLLVLFHFSESCEMCHVLNWSYIVASFSKTEVKCIVLKI